MKNSFYRLSSTSSLRKLAEWNDSEMSLEHVICPTTPGHQHAGKRKSTLSVTLPNTKVDDFVWTWYSELLIQEHVIHFFETHALTGYTVSSAKCKFKGKKAINTQPPLFEFKVIGWGGVAPIESGIKLISSCDRCKSTSYSQPTNPSRIFDYSQWDGSDFFMIWPLPKYIFISERAAILLRFSLFKGFELVPLSKLEFGDSGFSPGRLSHWMHPERAKLLGASLGIE